MRNNFSENKTKPINPHDNQKKEIFKKYKQTEINATQTTKT